MARRKFKVGDKIRVVKNMEIEGLYHNIKLGRKGKVANINQEYPEYLYHVQFKGPKFEYFNAKELEKVEGE